MTSLSCASTLTFVSSGIPSVLRPRAIRLGSIHKSASSPRTLPTRQTHRRQMPKCLEISEGQQKVLAGVCLPTLPVVAYSEFVLGTSGCGLPPGPGGLYGAVEGISYLVLAGVVALSVFVKIRTGKGLPSGPAGLLGAAEGVAYLLAVVGILDAVYVVQAFGSLPTAVPTEGSRCFVP